MAKRKTKIQDEIINITIDPELLTEMKAEARKPQEQRDRERDDFMREIYGMGGNHGVTGMVLGDLMRSVGCKDIPVATTKKSDDTTTAPVKKPGRFDDIIDII